jgi:UDP-glucose 4-epimerase
MNKKQSILVTGGAGYIGSHVANLLLDNDYNVTIIDSLITGNKQLVPKKANFFNCDISDQKEVTKIINQKKFELVMHFAGLIRVDESVKEPDKYYEFNYEKAKIFLNTCIKNNLKKIIFSSTASVYGNPKKDNVSENDLLDPLNPYAKSKLKLENYLIEQSKKEDIKYIILRYFNVAGADGQMRTGLISKHSTHLIKIASEVAIGKRDKIIINGDDYDTIDGTAVRDYIHVSDLADIHLISGKHLIANGESDIFNCGYGVGFSVKQVIENYNKILKKKIETTIGIRRTGDSKSVVANANKFYQKFLWEPKYNNLENILYSAYSWEKIIKNQK